jgi:membrane protein required for colicin V production
MNSIDIAVGVVLVISGVISLVRGFVHEVLSHAGWIASGLAAFWAYRLPQVHEISHRYVHNDLLADIAAGVVIFLVLLVVLSFFTHAVARRVQQSALGSTDRALGFVFGLVRGLVLCSLAYMVVIWLMPQPPDWFRDAKSLPLIKVGAGFIESLLPEQIAVLERTTKDAGAQGKQTSDTVDELKKDADLLKALEAPQPKAPDKPDDKKLPKKDDKGLDRLIETTTGH